MSCVCRCVHESPPFRRQGHMHVYECSAAVLMVLLVPHKCVVMTWRDPYEAGCYHRGHVSCLLPRFDVAASFQSGMFVREGAVHTELGRDSLARDRSFHVSELPPESTYMCIYAVHLNSMHPDLCSAYFVVVVCESATTQPEQLHTQLCWATLDRVAQRSVHCQHPMCGRFDQNSRSGTIALLKANGECFQNHCILWSQA